MRPWHEQGFASLAKFIETPPPRRKDPMKPDDVTINVDMKIDLSEADANAAAGILVAAERRLKELKGDADTSGLALFIGGPAHGETRFITDVTTQERYYAMNSAVDFYDNHAPAVAFGTLTHVYQPGPQAHGVTVFLHEDATPQALKNLRAAHDRLQVVEAQLDEERLSRAEAQQRAHDAEQRRDEESRLAEAWRASALKLWERRDTARAERDEQSFLAEVRKSRVKLAEDARDKAQAERDVERSRAEMWRVAATQLMKQRDKAREERDKARLREVRN